MVPCRGWSIGQIPVTSTFTSTNITVLIKGHNFHFFIQSLQLKLSQVYWFTGRITGCGDEGYESCSHTFQIWPHTYTSQCPNLAISIGKAIGWVAKICPLLVVVKVLAIHSTVKKLPLMRAQKFSHTKIKGLFIQMFQLLPKLVKKTLK